jgi:hypothetical protein
VILFFVMPQGLDIGDDLRIAEGFVDSRLKGYAPPVEHLRRILRERHCKSNARFVSVALVAGVQVLRFVLASIENAVPHLRWP